MQKETFSVSSTSPLAVTQTPPDTVTSTQTQVCPRPQVFFLIRWHGWIFCILIFIHVMFRFPRSPSPPPRRYSPPIQRRYSPSPLPAHKRRPSPPSAPPKRSSPRSSSSPPPRSRRSPPASSSGRQGSPQGRYPPAGSSPQRRGQSPSHSRAIRRVSRTPEPRNTQR